ncbi:MAG: hypothetical protein Q8K60_05500 [Parachlamydiaceae bacterium]|nr:hypothetical protein [Parachlamydiaceae bacterium]
MNIQLYNSIHRFTFLLVCILLLFIGFGNAQDIEKNFLEEFKNGLTVDLREPTYSNGVLSTDLGGVITASQIRIQAKKINYSKKQFEDEQVWKVEASEDLIVEFGEYIFVGEKLIYDFQNRSGVIYEGTTSVGAWFFGGEELQLRADGSYLLINGFVTTSENDIPEWGIFSKSVHIQNNHQMLAKDVKFRYMNIPILWIPSLRINLDTIFDSPIRYRLRWGGRQGPRAGFTYEIFSWNNWKTFVRFDYRFTRGPGGGIETYYDSLDNNTHFHSINYLCNDSSILHINEKARYRFEGEYRTSWNLNKTRFLLTYDKISDKDMPNFYYDQDFFIQKSYRTQMLIRHQEEYSITNFYTRVRINSFQTVKQQLPSLELNFKPREIQNTGIIFENYANASYLDFKYSEHMIHVDNYCSTRFQYRPTMYRPYNLGSFLTLTPEIGAITQLYGNTPHDGKEWLLMGKAACHLHTQLYRQYAKIKHVIEPYLSYYYLTSPTSSAHEHYIFDIDDGLTRLNALSFGIQNHVYGKQIELGFSRLLSANVYSFAFFNTHKMKQTIPRVYADFYITTSPTLRHVINTAWNFDFNQLDYINVRSDWTVDENLAIALEFRHRSSFSWRKVDANNFFLDLFHSEERLRHSFLSDRRDTLLINFFYRFHPNWAFEFTSRQGWNRKREPNYFEYELDLLTTIQSAWYLRISYQHQQTDDRFVMCINVGSPPSNEKQFEKLKYFYE